MKKFLVMMSVLALFAVGCNRGGGDQAGATGSGAGIEREEAQGSESSDVQNMESGSGSEMQSGDQQREEEYKTDDANITTPVDDQPELNEEQQ